MMMKPYDLGKTSAMLMNQIEKVWTCMRIGSRTENIISHDDIQGSSLLSNMKFFTLIILKTII